MGHSGWGLDEPAEDGALVHPPQGRDGGDDDGQRHGKVKRSVHHQDAALALSRRLLQQTPWHPPTRHQRAVKCIMPLRECHDAQFMKFMQLDYASHRSPCDPVADLFLSAPPNFLSRLLVFREPSCRKEELGGPPRALREGISKSIFQRRCQYLPINAHEMAPRTGQRLQERVWDTPT